MHTVGCEEGTPWLWPMYYELMNMQAVWFSTSMKRMNMTELHRSTCYLYVSKIGIRSGLGVQLGRKGEQVGGGAWLEQNTFCKTQNYLICDEYHTKSGKALALSSCINQRWPRLPVWLGLGSGGGGGGGEQPSWCQQHHLRIAAGDTILDVRDHKVRPGLCTHASHHTDYKDTDVHVLQWWNGHTWKIPQTQWPHSSSWGRK